MTAIVTVETILLAMMLLLVAGLLRSHAEILRTLSTPGSRYGGADLPAEENAGGVREALEFEGVTLAGEEILVSTIADKSRLLLAFLTSGCSSCRGIWRGLLHDADQLPPDTRVLVVTKDRKEESISRLRKLGAAEVPLVMSSPAWEAYRVPGSPYFVYLDGETVRGEGSADSWPSALSFVEDEIADAELEREQAAASSTNGPSASAASGRSDGQHEDVPVG
jgi:hypothetical protein